MPITTSNPAAVPAAPAEIAQSGDWVSDEASDLGARRDWADALKRGFRLKCPNCGSGRLFGGFLKVRDDCASCGEEFHHQRADDAPPYLTMFIVGHVLMGGLLALEKAYQPPTWVHVSIWFPLTIIMSAVLLPRIKGALIGLQWAHRMHGFGGANPGHLGD